MCSSYIYTYTTDVAPENRPFKAPFKETIIVFQPSIFRCKVAVRFREDIYFSISIYLQPAGDICRGAHHEGWPWSYPALGASLSSAERYITSGTCLLAPLWRSTSRPRLTLRKPTYPLARWDMLVCRGVISMFFMRSQAQTVSYQMFLFDAKSIPSFHWWIPMCFSRIVSVCHPLLMDC